MNCAMDLTCQEWVFGNESRQVNEAMSEIRAWLSDAGVGDQEDRARLIMGLQEAIDNAVYHGNLGLSSDLREADLSAYDRLADERRVASPYCHRLVHVNVSWQEGEVRVVIRDDGDGFDPDAAPDPTDPARLECVTGRGLLLIRSFMDRVWHNARGNQITMVKRCAAEPHQVQPSLVLANVA